MRINLEILKSKRIIQDLQSPPSPSSLSIWKSNGENERILFIASDQCSAYVSALRHASLYLCQGMLRNLPKVIQNHTYFMISHKMCHKIYALLKCLLLSIVWVMNLRPKYPVWSLGQCRIPKLWISDKRRTILGKLPREDLKSKLWRAKIHWKNLWNILKNTLGQSEKYFRKLLKILWKLSKTLWNTLEVVWNT